MLLQENSANKLVNSIQSFTERLLKKNFFSQIYHEAKKFGRAYNLTVCCVYGGGSKWEQSKAVKEGCEILVATPVSSL